MIRLFEPDEFAVLGGWRPVPPATDRAAWERVDPDQRSALLADAEPHYGTPWPVLTAGAYLRYDQGGDRSGFEQPYFDRRTRLAGAVLAAALTADERWLFEVVDGIWLLSEETSWCLPAHDRFVLDSDVPLPDPARPYLDLFAAETAGLLAFTDLLLADWLDKQVPGVRQRLRAEVAHRVLDPFRDRDDWWWFGRSGRVNNWNPWICSNVLAANLLLEPDPALRRTTASRVAEALGHFLTGYPADGGCDEGALYWWRAGGSLFDCLDALYQASEGELDAFRLPLVRRIARYPLVVHLADRWQVNFGDGSALVPADAPADLLYRFGRRVGDAEVMAHAVALGNTLTPAPGDRAINSLWRRLAGLFDAEWRAATPVDFPYPAQSWLPDLQVLTARQRAGSADGLFLAAKGGHNEESHNHNDVGSFVVGLAGRPVLVDAGVGTYTAATFSADRYSIWTMQSSFHNLPEINGWPQAAGANHRARDVTAELTAGHAQLSLDLAAAYPASAYVRRWQRTLKLDRAAEQVTIVDEWELDGAPEILVLNLVTAAPVTRPAAGRLWLPAGERTLTIEYDPARFAVSVQDIALTDAKLVAVWGSVLRRIRLTADKPASVGRHRLLLDSGKLGNSSTIAEGPD